MKGHHKLSMHAKYEVPISYGSKVMAKVKVDNKQTDRQTDRQTGQKQYAPIIRSGGIKSLVQMYRQKGLVTRNTHTKY